MVDTTITDQVCHTVRQLGFSKERTLVIVDGVRKDLANNGAEWVIGRLKSLRDYYVDPEVNQFPGWVKYRPKRYDVNYHVLDGSSATKSVRIPKGWMGKLVSRHNVKTTIAAVMTVTNAIVLSSPSEKQLEKWHSSCTNPPEPRKRKEIEHILSDTHCASRLSKSLKRKLEGRDFFGPEDIHGTNIPTVYGSCKVRIKSGKPVAHDLFHAWAESIISAPVSAWEQYWSLVERPEDSVRREIEKLRAEMRHQAPDTKRPRAVKGQSKRARSKKSLASKRGAGIAYVGDINFLQKPGGKLRTVANPNRFVQWLMTPLGEALGDYVNSLPGVYVKDQLAGQARIQRWLDDGVNLTSMDLSSASDTLDYRQIVDAILASEDCSPRLASSLRYFCQLSSGVWRISDPKAKEAYGPTLTWKQGQPLGLRPSFPMLTLTNYVAAALAFESVWPRSKDVFHRTLTLRNNPPWVIVGDDIVMPSSFAEAYAQSVSDLGGVINLEKSRKSRQGLKYAEFCSRLITPCECIRLKPRYLVDDDPQNILTYQGTGIVPHMPKWVRKSASYCGSFHLVESGLLPSWHGNQPRALPDKFLTHVALSLKEQGLSPEAEVSMETLYLQTKVSPSPTPIRTSEREIIRPNQGKKGLGNMSAEELVEFFIDRNPGVDLVELMCHTSWYGAKDLNRQKQKYMKMCRSNPLYSGTSDEEIESRFSESFLKGISPMGRQWVSDFIALAVGDPVVRSQMPTINLPVSFQVDEAALYLPHSVQKVQDKGVYDYTLDSYVPRTTPLTQLSKLERHLKAIERDMVHDGDKTHLITTVGGAVEMLIEDKGEGQYTVDFFSPDEQRHGSDASAPALTEYTVLHQETAPTATREVRGKWKDASSLGEERTPDEVPLDPDNDNPYPY